jgi:RNA polymerase subunit RPABC4/transcription elongation factor Spt4
MDTPSGLKECPRCGLRNRTGAYQCDFCGWDFKTVSDDWMGNVKSLEQLGKEASSDALDKKVESKIEMTIKRPSDIPLREKKTESNLTIPQYQEREGDTGETVALPIFQEQSLAEEQTELPVETSITTSPVTPGIEAELDTETESTPVASSITKLGSPTTIGLLATGAVVYLATLAMAALHSIGTVEGWCLAVLGAFFLVAGVGSFLSKRHRTMDEDEVILCPKCHEVVSEKDQSCPSCGAKFTPSIKE